MASIKKGKSPSKRKPRDPQAEAYAALRRRAKREYGRLGSLYDALSPTEQRGAVGRSIKEHQLSLDAAIKGTYLGTNADKDTRLAARKAANKVERMIPEKNARESRKSRQERQDRVFRSQIREEEEHGKPSARFNGEAGAQHRERVFYMATQALWTGKDPKDREAAIISQLGVSSLEEAYDVVMAQNQEALDEMERQFGSGFVKWKRGDSDPIMAYITNMVRFVQPR